MTAVQFYIAESWRIHALLDAENVPRFAEGEILSLSQRVEELLRMHKDRP